MNRILRRPRDERGAILIMATVGLVLAVICSALAIDLGRVAQERRRDQRVADLAALDALRAVGGGAGGIQNAAEVSAAGLAKDGSGGNHFPLSPPDYSVTAIFGTKSGGTCVASGTTTSVCVTVRSTVKNAFQPGSPVVIARAQAGLQNEGSFSIGSSLASLDANKTVLNQFLGRWLNTPGTVNVVSYAGLASSTVTLQALQTKLLAMGLDVGTTSKLMNTSLTVKQLLTATAQAMSPGGPTAAADVNNLALATNLPATIMLKDLITVAEGADSAALATQVNVFRLIQGSASVANGTNFVNVPTVTVTIPGLTSVAVGLKVIEPPKIYIGPTTAPTPHAQTSQVQLTVTPVIATPSVLGISVGGSLPISVTAAKATGNLAAINCASPTGITVDATTGAATVSAGAVLDVTLPLVGSLHVLNVHLAGNAGSGSFPGLNFTYPSGYGPPGQHVGNTVANLGTLLTADSGNAAVSAVLSTVTGLLQPVLNAVDTQVVRPLLQAAGADLGTADVVALPVTVGGVTSGAFCGNFALQA